TRAEMEEGARWGRTRGRKGGGGKGGGGAPRGPPPRGGGAPPPPPPRRTLREADPERYRDALARADSWFRKLPVKSVLDAAAVLLALDGADDAGAERQKRHSLELIGKGQAREGGWGPFITSPPEVFDTALVLLALVRQKRTAEVAAQIDRGRQYLIARQQKDGSWPETTRPSGSESYAQRLSTAGWATQALLATRTSK